MTELSEKVKALTAACDACGICQTACPFLKAEGTPGKILSTDPEAAFHCANCRSCYELCPAGLHPAGVFLQAKEDFVKSGHIPPAVRKCLDSAKSFAATGARFPFVWYSRADTIFWPGCSLSGQNPGLVRKITEALADELHERVGLGLDCCFDPLYQLGDVESMEEAVGRISERLKTHRVNRVITGCVNCWKVLATRLADLKVIHVLEVLPQGILRVNAKEPLFLHHPCPTSGMGTLREAAERHAAGGCIPAEGSSRAMCCGRGGGLPEVSEILSNEFAAAVMSAAGDRPIVTYCMGCKTRFVEKGKRAYHLLEFLPGARKLDRNVSPARSWVNRLVLSVGQKIKSPRFLLAMAVVFLIVVGIYLRKEGHISFEGFFGFLAAHRVLAPVLFVLIYGVVPALFLPSIPLSLGAGFLWGPYWGVFYTLMGATLGASVSFLVARYVTGDAIKVRFGESKWRTLSETVEKHGWKAVAVARLIPVLPFNGLNYLFGITPIPFSHYLFASLVFMLPGCIAFVAFGSSVGSIAKGNVRDLVIGIIVASLALLLPLTLRPIRNKIFGAKGMKSTKGGEKKQI